MQAHRHPPSDKPGHTPTRKSFEAPGADHEYRKRERGEPRTLPVREISYPPGRESIGAQRRA